MKLKNKKQLKNKNDLLKFLKKNWTILLALFYFIFPLDFIPDILPAFGLGDDIFILIATFLVNYRKHKKEQDKEKEDIVEGEIINE